LYGKACEILLIVKFHTLFNLEVSFDLPLRYASPSGQKNTLHFSLKPVLSLPLRYASPSGQKNTLHFSLKPVLSLPLRFTSLSGQKNDPVLLAGSFFVTNL